MKVGIMPEKIKFVAHLYVYNATREVWENLKGIYSRGEIIEVINRCVEHPETIRVTEIYQTS